MRPTIGLLVLCLQNQDILTSSNVIAQLLSSYFRLFFGGKFPSCLRDHNSDVVSRAFPDKTDMAASATKRGLLRDIRFRTMDIKRRRLLCSQTSRRTNELEHGVPPVHQGMRSCCTASHGVELCLSV